MCDFNAPVEPGFEHHFFVQLARIAGALSAGCLTAEASPAMPGADGYCRHCGVAPPDIV